MFKILHQNVRVKEVKVKEEEGLLEVLPGGHSAGLFRRMSGERQVSGLDAGAGCSAKTISVWADMLGGVGDSE